MSSANRVFTTPEKTKLTQIINEALSVMSEIETLNEGLSDTVKAVAEEMDIKPSVLKKAIRVAHKSRLAETNEENEEINQILATVGRTQ